eukprot:COSAG02_NODE_30600_length_548_cov_1.077951_1_plen_94_part_00
MRTVQNRKKIASDTDRTKTFTVVLELRAHRTQGTLRENQVRSHSYEVNFGSTISGTFRISCALRTKTTVGAELPDRSAHELEFYPLAIIPNNC